MATVRNRDQRDFRISAGSTKTESLDFSQIKVGNKTIKDVALDLDFFKRPQRKWTAEKVNRALEMRDIVSLRAISNHFYDLNGIYSRLCRYMAYLYRYDWITVPNVYDKSIKGDKIVEGWYKSSVLLENSGLKRRFREIALKVVKNGCYYGYIIDQKTASYLQELPVDYCRSRYAVNGKPAVEFNIKYFNDRFSDTSYRIKVLKMFPKEFQKAYVAFQEGKLARDFQGDDTGWFLLDPEMTVKFSLDESDAPLFVQIVPALIDLADAQDIDKQKMAQQILRIIIQKMPIDKNGDLIFDVGEAQALHSNAVAMLSDAIGVDVLTTFADVSVADMSDHGNVSSVDQLNKIERRVFNEAGVSQMQFNTDGNLALEKSIANDEATMLDLVLQFEDYAERLLKPFNKNSKRLSYNFQMLPTTIYNYKDLSKLYKEQTMLGFSKLLPQVALGHTQSSIIATAYFENELMNLDELFVPPQMSSTMSGKDNNKKDASNTKEVSGQGQGGRPELPDSEKSDKTIRNKESGG